jgi:hypothetical protein
MLFQTASSETTDGWFGGVPQTAENLSITLFKFAKCASFPDDCPSSLLYNEPQGRLHLHPARPI